MVHEHPSFQNGVTIAVREISRNPGHVYLSVWMGRDPGARGHCGDLVVRTDEWDDLRHNAQVGGNEFKLLVEELP